MWDFLWKVAILAIAGPVVVWVFFMAVSLVVAVLSSIVDYFRGV